MAIYGYINVRIYLNSNFPINYKPKNNYKMSKNSNYFRIIPKEKTPRNVFN